MGIKYLNRIFNSNCNDTSIYKIHLQHFAGKRIAVDASIFLYRFLGEEKLIEQMYLMVSIFRNYDITPIFVFDGVAPPEGRRGGAGGVRRPEEFRPSFLTKKMKLFLIQGRSRILTRGNTG